MKERERTTVSAGFAYLVLVSITVLRGNCKKNAAPLARSETVRHDKPYNRQAVRACRSAGHRPAPDGSEIWAMDDLHADESGSHYSNRKSNVLVTVRQTHQAIER